MKIFLNSSYSYAFASSSYDVVSLDYTNFAFQKPPIYSIINRGLAVLSKQALLENPKYIQHLFQEKDKEYFRFLDCFYQIACECDAIVLNPGVDLVHPEFLDNHFKSKVKCLHHVDDPHLSYNFSSPFAWAFDCASYISPIYNEDLRMNDYLHKIGFSNTFWLPLTFSSATPSYNSVLDSWDSRVPNALYIGNEYSQKSKYLSKLRSHLGDSFRIYGSYKLSGLPFLCSNINSLWRAPILPKKISNSQRSKLYLSSSVGFNIHLSFPKKRECGNARTYELAAHGVAQVVDNVGLDDDLIFSDSEVITYNSIAEAVEIISYLLRNPSKARQLGLSSYARFHSCYNSELVFSKFFNWLCSQTK